MESPTSLNAGEPPKEASVDACCTPTRNQQCDGGDHELGVCWPKHDVAPGTSFLYEDDISPPIPIDPRYFEDPTTNDDDEDSNVLKLFPDVCATPLHEFCSQLAPAVGSVSYCYFSLSNMDPAWFGKAFGGVQGQVSNLMWLQAHVGAGLYMLSRRHIRTLPVGRAVFYSLVGSVLFNFGSCMLWGLGRSVLKASPNACRLFGLASSCLLLYAGHDYLQCVDDRCTELD